MNGNFEKSAVALGRALQQGKLDPVDLAQEALAKIARCIDQAIFTEVLEKRALTEAKASYKRLKAGEPLSALDGVPIGWKDLFDIKGRATTAGSVVLKSAAPARADAALVAAGARAGLVSIGCLNMTEFAYSGIGLNPHYGTPKNPHGFGASRVPGGSSAGCGVAVARGILPLAIGTDTGGSVRIPASFNGVVGYKASTRHYDMGGVFPLSKSLDSLGPLARSVEDCVAADAVLRGTRKPRRVNLRDVTVLIPHDVVFDNCQPSVLANFDSAMARVKRAGAKIRQVKMPAFQATIDVIAKRGHMLGAEALALHWDLVNGPDVARMDQRVASRLQATKAMTAVNLVEVQQARARLIAESDALIGDGILAFPSTATVAMEIAPLEADTAAFFRANSLTLRNTMLGNFLDWCGLSIPNGVDGDGMPTGFLLSAAHGRDAAVLSAGLAIEELVRG